MPVGISDYVRAQLEYYYVDKTLLIKEFLDRKPLVSLFTRPRRFGKTLNMDMLRVFFEISEEDTSKYFADKAIWKCGEQYRFHQGKYPVVFLTFKDVKFGTWEATIDKIKALLQEEYGRHQELQNSDKISKYEKEYFAKILDGTANEVELTSALEKLSKMLAAHYGKAPIILIDEYDTPIQEGDDMKILVIPDVHLKPQMFKQAAALMHQGIADRAVCLMDIPDDWDKQYDIALYEETYDEAIRFAKAFPDTAWCYGNHDLSYLWHCLESGYSSMASLTVQRKLLDLRVAVPEDNPIKYVQRIDNVLFSHGGVLNFFVEEYVPRAKYNDVDAVLETINQLGRIEMWNDASPIWLRPQHSKMRLYKPRKLLQVVGHTPMDEITREGNLISTDVFSTYRDGKPIGTEEFLLLDTVTWEYCGIKM